MTNSIQDNCFVLGKFIFLIGFLGYRLISSDQGSLNTACQGLLLAAFVFFAVMIEFTSTKKSKRIMYIFEGILSLLGVFLFPVSGLVFLIFAFVDICATENASFAIYLLAYLILVPFNRLTGQMELGIGMITFIIIAYFQEKIIIRKYKDDIHTEESLQSDLKFDMESQEKHHNEVIRKNNLMYENQILADRNRISQALHDKLGHSINGSLYQLEAAKLLVDKNPRESQQIIQKVIDELRFSMDEIRAILRSERPKKREMALVALQDLMEECESKYGIEVVLVIKDEQKTIPEDIWEIILDNTNEAITNSLKYSKCRKITVDIIAMNEVCRCCIKDDGIGCSNLEEGMGITGMKSRVRKVKGFIDFSSELGFCINMILPIK